MYQSNNYKHNHKNNSQNKESIPSPYNFVPLSKEIVFLDEWSEKISHDIPFEDGISGTISLTVTTESPTYIRNGGNWTDEDRKQDNSLMQNFFQVSDGTNYIPGTSFKGMLRNVLEIATFSKMKLVDKKRYSIRDLRNRKDYTSKMTIRDGNGFKSTVKSGWLQKINGKVTIIPCDYARVELNDLENYYAGKINLKSKQSAISKYKKWSTNLDITFDIDSNDRHKHSCGILVYHKAINIGRGLNKGKIVFTGQPTTYKSRAKGRKHLEFIFHNSKTTSIININEELFRDFVFIHSDEKGNPNEEWKHWKSLFDRGEKVPVFYLTDTRGSISSMGLAMMYRLAYDNNIYETIAHTDKNHIKSDKIDFADAIFGFTNKQKSLKGRVQIGHFIQTNDKKEMSCLTTVLGGPKPTYYPNYIDQEGTRIINGKRVYKTFMDKDAQIRGWKRYPVQNDKLELNDLPKPPIDKNGKRNLEVATKFKPLPIGSIFRGKIKLHNLKPEELGALIWSLTLGNNKDCRHSIGMAKPLGFGIIKLSIDSEGTKLYQIKDNATIKFSNATKPFKEYIEKKIGDNLSDSPQIKELIAMANKQVDVYYDNRYPMLDPQNRNRDLKNEFLTLKKNNQFLHKYTECTIRKKPIYTLPKQQISQITPKDGKVFSLDDIVRKIKSAKIKEVRKIIISLDKEPEFKKSDLNRIYSALKKRNDFAQQKWTSENKNYISIFNDLKNKFK